MPSESAWNNSPDQSRFRVQAPNAAPRSTLVVALDERSAALGGRLAQTAWRGVRFAGFSGIGEKGGLAALACGDADLVVMVGTAGQDLGSAKTLGERCQAGNVKVSGVLLASGNEEGETIAAGLQALRAWSRTLALLREADDLCGFLHALGA